ncbi:hypothetical protein SAV31267_013080 [Streptomyces avermitilis]|uniref:cysteine-S-conjugate beta-lyase n=1 Tax=Streptomyces avermitilis TaxID=33903 RepID=A0A4D4MIE4_STRAX|nr:hypothetical protein SAV31267_013080 [Streptomyces avermitilis]
MKWRTYPDDVLPLWVAEMDVPLAEPVVRAVTDAVACGDTGYPAGTAYAEALAGFARKRWGWDGIAVERTAIVPDVMLGIVEALKLVTGPGEAVVVNSPVYPPFYQFVEHMDRRVEEAPLGADLRLDLDVLEAAFRRTVAGGRRAAYLLCSPHNPTGTVHTAAELAAVAALAGRYGLRVVADEIHAPLLASGVDFVPYLSVPGAENGLSLMSASKAWNLAGLKAALAVAGPRPPPTWRGCPKRSATARAMSASSPTPPPCATAPPGWTRCWPASTTTAVCSPRCWPSTCPPSSTAPVTPRISPGSTAVRSASATIPRRSSWNAAGSR